VEHEQRSDKSRGIEGHFARYEVYDRDGEKIGKVDDLFVDDNDRPEYVGVKVGFLDNRSTLIPMEIMRIDKEREALELDQPKSVIKDGPTFDVDDEEITPELEERVRNHYGMGSSQESPDSGDEDELRVQRAEEEIVAGTREREAGKLNVRKRVRTEREQVRVPKRREEVETERVPGEGREASEAEIGEKEIVVQVFEEEIVASKRVVLKEEIRIRKNVVEELEIVKADVRKEGVDIQDSTRRRGGDR
jgi:uncharacterized protein (TIGR02271 family)